MPAITQIAGRELLKEYVLSGSVQEPNAVNLMARVASQLLTPGGEIVRPRLDSVA